MKKLILTLGLTALFFSFSNLPVVSYPKFAALTGSKCQSCHVNPTGGGMRSAWGVKYSKLNLFLKPLEKANKTTDIDPQISKGITIGGDMRLLFMDHENGEGNPKINSFFQMQGDLYVNAQVNKYINLMIAPGLYIPNTFGLSPLATKYEIYGMVSNLPAGIYFKAGRFIPNFGLKLPEHRAYNRQFNDLYTPYASDAGIEFGISPEFSQGSLTFTAALSNGSSANVNNQINNSFDFDNQKQFTSSLGLWWAGKKEKYGFGVGGSYVNNPYKYDNLNNVNALKQAVAAYIAIGLFKRVSILGEWTYNRLELTSAPDSKFDQRTGFGEIDIRLVSGLEVKGQYEHYDNLPNNVLDRRRYSFGLVIFPLTGLEVEPVFRVVQEPNGPELKNNEFQTVFKFYF